MNRKERAAIVHRRLDELYPETDVPLEHNDPYTLLVAVVLSAQCTDKMVNRITPSLWKLADTPQAMSKQPVAKIQKVIQPCGLSPQKAKAISGLSKKIGRAHV